MSSTSPRSDKLHPPRVRYHSAKEPIRESTSPKSKRLNSPRIRRIVVKKPFRESARPKSNTPRIRRIVVRKPFRESTSSNSNKPNTPPVEGHVVKEHSCKSTNLNFNKPNTPPVEDHDAKEQSRKSTSPNSNKPNTPLVEDHVAEKQSRKSTNPNFNKPKTPPAEGHVAKEQSRKSTSPRSSKPNPPRSRCHVAKEHSREALSSTVSARAPVKILKSQIVSANVRHAMRLIPQSLAIVVAGRQRDTAGSAEPEQGLLVSSWTIVTLDPRPVVIISLRVPSAAYDAIRAKRGFRLYPVSDSQTADAFARPFKPTTTSSPEATVLDAQRRLRMRDNIEKQAPWCLACEIARSELWGIVGDHVLILGRVHGMWTPKRQDEDGGNPGAILYQDGAYRAVGSQLRLGGEQMTGHTPAPTNARTVATAPSGAEGNSSGRSIGEMLADLDRTKREIRDLLSRSGKIRIPQTAPQGGELPDLDAGESRSQNRASPLSRGNPGISPSEISSAGIGTNTPAGETGHNVSDLSHLPHDTRAEVRQLLWFARTIDLHIHNPDFYELLRLGKSTLGLGKSQDAQDLTGIAGAPVEASQQTQVAPERFDNKMVDVRPPPYVRARAEHIKTMEARAAKSEPPSRPNGDLQNAKPAPRKVIRYMILREPPDNPSEEPPAPALLPHEKGRLPSFSRSTTTPAQAREPEPADAPGSAWPHEQPGGAQFRLFKHMAPDPTLVWVKEEMPPTVGLLAGVDGQSGMTPSVDADEPPEREPPAPSP